MSLTRRQLLEGTLGLCAPAALACARASAPSSPQPSPDSAVTSPSPSRMPVVFVGHGNPMNAIEDTPWRRGFAELGLALPRPKAVLAISAHWYLPAVAVTGNARPPTLHDFGGFPDELYQQQYPAPGEPALAARLARRLGPGAQVREDWGLDHGAWTVLKHLLPRADVPVLQLSLDERLSPREHLALAERLRELRDEGVLLLGSGNITHNLRAAIMALRTGDTRTPAWARTFDEEVTRALGQQDRAWLARALDTEAGRLAHPTPDHYLPLLYVVGAAHQGEAVRFPVSGFDLGSLSMRAAVYG